jgi:ribosome biogenesis GTPase
MLERDVLGWSAHWEELAQPFLTGPDTFPARVAFASHTKVRLLGRRGEESAVLTGRARRMYPEPAVGDWVVAFEASGGTVAVRAVLPRRNRLARGNTDRRRTDESLAAEQVLAANLDRVIIVCGLDRDYNPRRIERYVTLAWSGGVEPALVLNKADLRTDVDRLVAQTRALAPGAAVLAVSARDGEGVEAVRRLAAAGQTVCLVGSSGAGKTTLLNRLLGSEARPTAATSEATGKGRHTTTRREMYILPGGGVVIDTPGLRAVGLDLGEEGLDAAFCDIAQLARGCRFRDCRHEGEPGCAVQAAADHGDLDPARWESYRRLGREARYRQLAADAGTAAAERKRWRSIHKELRRMTHG